MPCGGIFPIKGSWVEQHSQPGKQRCFQCEKTEPVPELFCSEWDCELHVGCLIAFLQTEEGRCLLAHGHEIYVPLELWTNAA